MNFIDFSFTPGVILVSQVLSYCTFVPVHCFSWFWSSYGKLIGSSLNALFLTKLDFARLLDFLSVFSVSEYQVKEILSSSAKFMPIHLVILWIHVEFAKTSALSLHNDFSRSFKIILSGEIRLPLIYWCYELLISSKFRSTFQSLGIFLICENFIS